MAGVILAILLAVFASTSGLDGDLLALQRLGFANTASHDFNEAIAAYERGDYGDAARRLHPLAERGNAEAQFELGLMYRYGLGVKRDYGEAAKWFKLAAEQGNEGGQSNLGSMYQQGLGVRQDHGEAVKWFRLAAERGEAEAQSFLSTAYLQGRGIRRNYVEAYKWASIAAGQGAERAIGDLDALATKMNPAQIEEAERRVREWDPEVTIEVPAKLPEPRVPPAHDEHVPVHKVQEMLTQLGYATGNIDGIAGRRTRAAVREFRRREGLQVSNKLTGDLVKQLEDRVKAQATETAELEAQLAASRRRAQARPQALPRPQRTAADDTAEPPRNQIAAVPPRPRRIEDSARLNEAREYFRRGYGYAIGDGVSRSDAEARKWYRKAAELGLPEAQYNLGVLAARNPDLKAGRNFYEAVRWWQRAAENGNAEAQNALGVSYFKGLGAAQDLAAALHWFAVAADQGYTEAQLNLANMYENGQGTAPDPVAAYKWYAVAAAGGLDKAVADRDRLARRLSPAQLRDGRRQVRDWIDRRS